MLTSLEKILSFINIITEEDVLFEWKPPQSLRSFVLDLNIIRENQMNEIFFHINKGNMKMAYIRKGKIIYSIGADESIQYQVLEAVLEAIMNKFNEIYEADVILSYGIVSNSMFSGFKADAEQIVREFNDLNTCKKVNVFCKVCNKNLPLFIKKSVIDNSDSFPVPIVYNHKGHAILVYIDKNYAVRGVEIVNITG